MKYPGNHQNTWTLVSDGNNSLIHMYIFTDRKIKKTVKQEEDPTPMFCVYEIPPQRRIGGHWSGLLAVNWNELLQDIFLELHKLHVQVPNSWHCGSIDNNGFWSVFCGLWFRSDENLNILWAVLWIWEVCSAVLCTIVNHTETVGQCGRSEGGTSGLLHQLNLYYLRFMTFVSFQFYYLKMSTSFNETNLDFCDFSYSGKIAAVL